MDDPIELDASSLRILAELQRDSRQTVQAIAEKVGLSPTPCWRRIRDMEQAGVVRGYTALVDRARVGLKLQVVVEVNLDRHTEDVVQRFEREVAATPQIVRCFSTTGPADYVLMVLVPDIERYDRLLHGTLFKLPGVTHVRSSIVLKELKAECGLPVEALGAAEPERRRRRTRG